MKNKLCAKIRSDFYTIWVLTDQISSKNRLCAKIRSYILYLFPSHSQPCFLALDTQIKVRFWLSHTKLQHFYLLYLLLITVANLRLVSP